MGLTPEQRRLANIAAMYGHRNILEDTVPVSRFEPGDGAIVLTMKGEPVMSGTVTEIKPDDDLYGNGAIRIGDVWYYGDSHKFRLL